MFKNHWVAIVYGDSYGLHGCMCHLGIFILNIYLAGFKQIFTNGKYRIMLPSENWNLIWIKIVKIWRWKAFLKLKETTAVMSSSNQIFIHLGYFVAHKGSCLILCYLKTPLRLSSYSNTLVQHSSWLLDSNIAQSS